MQLNIKSGFFLSVILISVMLLIITSMTYILIVDKQLNKKHSPLIVAAEEIKLQTALAHLWFEEIISGDTVKTYDDVLRHIELAQWYTNSIIEGGTNDEMTIVPIKDTLLQKEIIQVQEKLEEYKEITLERWTHKNVSEIGSAIDQKYDEIFEAFQQKASLVEHNIRNYTVEKRHNSHTVQLFLIIVSFLLFITIIIIIRIYVVSLKNVEIALKKDQVQLNEKNDELLSFNEEYETLNEELKQTNSELIFATEKAEENENKLKQAINIINSSPVIAFLWKNKENWPVEYVSENVKTLFGYSTDEFTSGKIEYANVIHPDDLNRVLDEVSASSQNLNINSFKHKPYRIITKNGKIKWINDHTAIIRSPIKDITHYQGIVLDVTDKKKSEQALEESEKKFRNFFEMNRSIMLQVNPDSMKIIDANNSAVDFYKFNKTDLLKKSMFELNTLPKEEIKQLMKTAVEQNSNYFNFQHKLANGEIKDVEVYASPIKIRNKRIMFVIIQDITVRKIVEMKLKNSETKLRKILNSFTDGIYICSPDYKIEYLNAPMAKLIGKEKIGATCYKSIYNLDKKCDWCVSEKLKSGQTTDYEINAPSLNGDFIVKCIFLENGSILYDFYDVTKIKEAEKEIKKLSTAVGQSANTIVITDLEGNIEYVNPKFTELTGYTTQEAIGQNPRILQAGTQSKEFYDELWQTIRTGKPWHGEFHNKTKDNKLFWEQSTITPIKDEAGNIVNYLAVKEDITARKKAEEELSHLL